MKSIIISPLVLTILFSVSHAEVIFKGELGKMAFFKRTFVFSESDLEMCEKNWTSKSVNSTIGVYFTSGCKLELISKNKNPQEKLWNKYANKNWDDYVVVNDELVWGKISPNTEGLFIFFHPRNENNTDFKFYKNTIKEYLIHSNWKLDVYFYALDEQHAESSNVQTIRLDDAFVVQREYEIDLGNCALNWSKRSDISYGCEISQFSASTSSLSFNPGWISGSKNYGTRKANFQITGKDGDFNLYVVSSDFTKGLPTDFMFYESDIKALVKKGSSPENTLISQELISKSEMGEPNNKKQKLLGFGILNEVIFQLTKEECKLNWIIESDPSTYSSYGFCDIETGAAINNMSWDLGYESFSAYDFLPNGEEKAFTASFLTGADTFYVEYGTYPISDVSFEFVWQVIEKYLSGHGFDFSYHYMSIKE